MTVEYPTVCLKARRARPFFGRHPWVFSSAIDSVIAETDSLDPGTCVKLVTDKGEFVAWGLWNDKSTIHVRLYSWDQERPFDDYLIRQRINTAVEQRRLRFELSPAHGGRTGCRLIFSEGDELSGLTVDYYAGFLLVQFTSLALYQYRETILQTLQEAVQPLGIWLRTEKGVRDAEGLEAVDGLLSGESPPRPLFIAEHGIQYGVDVQEGQKTGCYLDQRDNRLAAAAWLRGSILDAYCFSGGFGITALKCGRAESVVCMDSSESALKIAQANAELNEVADRCEFVRADVKTKLPELAEQQTLFDGVILDPPRMARTRGGLNRALKAYQRINESGLRLLKPGGILVTCSCSGLVSREAFLEMIAIVARESGRSIQILEQHGQPGDHPVSATCPESEYLKMLICRVM